MPARMAELELRGIEGDVFLERLCLIHDTIEGIKAEAKRRAQEG